MSDAAGVIFLIGRVLFVVFFAFAARSHLTSGPMMVGYARSKGAPLADLGGWPGGVWLAVGSLSIALGIWPDIGALMLALFVIPMAYFIHNFWTLKDAQQRQTELGNFNRNVTYLGAALALFATFVALGHNLKFTITGPLLHF